MLRSLVTKNKLKFTVFVKTLSNPFNSWIFSKVCELYDLSEDPNPNIDVYSHFECGSADLNDEKSKFTIKHLMAELDLRKKITLLVLAYETTKSIYLYCYLTSDVSLFENNFKIVLKKLVKRHNSQGNLDLAIEC